jgi:hypothetical protein
MGWQSIVLGLLVGLLLVGGIIIFAFRVETRPGRKRSRLAPSSGRSDDGNHSQPLSSHESSSASHH